MAFMWLFLLLMVTLVWRDVARSRRMHRAMTEQEKIIEARIKAEEIARDFVPAFDLGTPAGTNAAAVPKDGGKRD